MRTTRRLVTAGAVAMLAAAMPSVSLAADGVRVTTPYPAVAVQPGQSTTFDLVVTGTGRQRVDLEVTDQPDGWTVTLRGGGFVIDGVFTDPDTPPTVQLEVEVPVDAAEGDYQVVVVGSSPGGTDTLPLDLRVSAAVGGSVELTADFPSQEAPSDATFTFNLTLENNTPQEITFGLETAGPPGFVVEASPSGQEQASTVPVPGGSSTSISVTVDPPDDAAAGVYPVGVRATGGGQAVETALEVEITGTFLLTLTTPDERLSADVVAGRASTIDLLVLNDGTAPLVGVTLSGTPPAGWEVTFQPEVIDQVPAGGQVQVQATVTPSGEAVAGDYQVTFQANGQEASDSIEVRTTVKTSGLFGVVGLALIAVAVGVLAYVFRRYGRR